MNNLSGYYSLTLSNITPSRFSSVYSFIVILNCVNLLKSTYGSSIGCGGGITTYCYYYWGGGLAPFLFLSARAFCCYSYSSYAFLADSYILANLSFSA